MLYYWGFPLARYPSIQSRVNNLYGHLEYVCVCGYTHRDVSISVFLCNFCGICMSIHIQYVHTCYQLWISHNQLKYHKLILIWVCIFPSSFSLRTLFPCCTLAYLFSKCFRWFQIVRNPSDVARTQSDLRYCDFIQILDMCLFGHTCSPHSWN